MKRSEWADKASALEKRAGEAGVGHSQTTLWLPATTTCSTHSAPPIQWPCRQPHPNDQTELLLLLPSLRSTKASQHFEQNEKEKEKKN